MKYSIPRISNFLYPKFNLKIGHFRCDKKHQKCPTFNLNFRVSKIRIFQIFKLFLALEYSNLDMKYSILRISNFLYPKT